MTSKSNTAIGPMQRECAWCHTVMQSGTRPATHGICPACVAKLES